MGRGSAVLAAAFPEVGIGLLGAALAFGHPVPTTGCAIGHVSGCHLNPAASGFAASGNGKHSPGGCSLTAGLVAEVALTMMFLFVIMGATHWRASRPSPPGPR